MRLYWKTVLKDPFYLKTHVFSFIELAVVLEPDPVNQNRSSCVCDLSCVLSPVHEIRPGRNPVGSANSSYKTYSEITDSPTGKFYECRETRAAETLREGLIGVTLRQVRLSDRWDKSIQVNYELSSRNRCQQDLNCWFGSRGADKKVGQCKKLKTHWKLKTTTLTKSWSILIREQFSSECTSSGKHYLFR